MGAALEDYAEIVVSKRSFDDKGFSFFFFFLFELTEEELALVPEADDAEPLAVAVAVEEAEALLDSAASQAAVELLAAVAAPTLPWVPLSGVVERPHDAAVAFSSEP